VIIIERIAPALVLVLFMLGASRVAGAADRQQQPLPDVSVTAPDGPDPYGGDPRTARVVPPTEINPYYGRNRVDESVFAEKPCSETRLSANVAGSKCLEGYKIGADSAANVCHIQLDVVMGTTAIYDFEADVFVFDPYLVSSGGPMPKGCAVSKQPKYNLARLQDMNQMTRRGANWRNYVNNYVDSGGDISSEYSDGRLSCLAFRRLGPNWHGGVVWSIHAAICRLDGTAVEPADIHALLSSLQIRVYDPRGNLRPPEQSIMYMTPE
jgi:hypothetical protein